ncbi:MAG: ABC transporter permease [Blautia sp.]|uniref:ABC transporter permease n=1 Tax=Blautia sp. TaxID=1955243 RepID=UPI002E794D84|nr:ABC transporter permease [Blautia sp.]MEE1444249.1 ABC transporter permease [Blautia sp.]
MLFSLSVKNFKKSIRDYSIYFFTMILGIAVFYIFNAIETQTAMMEVTKIKAAIIDMMNGVMDGVSIFVSFILGYLIVYASRFMLKKRKMEFGVYITLGMSRVKIAGILWMETIWMGVISLVAGLLVGTGISQFMSLMVSHLFQADVSRFVFVISWKAVVKSILYFLIIYTVVMVLNTIAISRTKLIDFMTAGRKKEKNLLKNPVVSVVIFLLAWGILGYAYYNVTAGSENLESEFQVLAQVLLGIVGTILVFWSFAGFFMWILGKMPKIYYKKINSFVFGELSNKLNSTVISCSVICLLMFMTICILFSAFARKDFKEAEAKRLAPVDISMVKDLGDGKTIEEIMEEKDISGKDFQDTLNLTTYELPEVTKGNIVGDAVDRERFGEAYLNQQIELLSVSTYNQAAEKYHLPTYELEENQYLVIADMEGAVGIFNMGLKENPELTIKGKTYYPKEKTCQDGFLMMNYDPQNMGFILVPDSVKFTEAEQKKNYFIADYAKDTKAFREEMDEEFFERLNGEKSDEFSVYFTTQSSVYDDSIGSSAMYIFLGLYLGICFLISGSAVLSLKMLSDAADSKEKYRILQKLGCDQKQICRGLRKQNGMVFLLPVILAAVHSVFGIQVCMEMLSIYETKGTAPALVLTMILIGMIYGGYYLVSQFGCEKIVRE